MSMPTILSGEDMVLAHSKTSYELPPVGVKDFQPTHSWLEQKQIQSALDNRKTLLEAERIEKESNLMTADWRPERHKAEVSRKGKHWETFGHHTDDADWLFPEEVLFLMEMNCLQIFYGEVPLSIQKAYSLLLKPENECTCDEYKVFSHLCRAGYRVLRHLPSLTVTAYEKAIRLDEHLKERNTYGEVVGDVTATETESTRNLTDEEMSQSITEKHEVCDTDGDIVEEKIRGETSCNKKQASGNAQCSKKIVGEKFNNIETEKPKELRTESDVTENRNDMETRGKKYQVSDNFEGIEKMVEDSLEDVIVEKHEKCKTVNNVEVAEESNSHKTQASYMLAEDNKKRVEVSSSLEDVIVEKHKKHKTVNDVEFAEESNSHKTPASYILKEDNKKRVEVNTEDIVTENHKKHSTDCDIVEERIAEKTCSDKIQSSDNLVGNSEEIRKDSEQDIFTEEKETSLEKEGNFNENSQSSNNILEDVISTSKEYKEPKKTLTTVTGLLTKRKLRKIQRKNFKLAERTKGLLQNIAASRKTLESINLKRSLSSIGKKCGLPLKKSGAQDQSSRSKNVDAQRTRKNIRSLFDVEEEAPVFLPERWQPPVVISEIPEDVEEPIEVIDIADSSSEEEQEETDEVESDSDIEIIEEITTLAHRDAEEEEDDCEIIEVPMPKKEIIVETLSSDSEVEDDSASDSERSYDGNWKRNESKKVKKKFVRPPTMSHLTFAAVDEFCVESKPKDSVNQENSTTSEQRNGTELVASSSSRPKRPVFQVENTRNEILDSMPTLAGQNQKLMTLNSPDLRLIPDSIILKQPSYTYSTNVLRARVFRQGFRGRRNFHGMRFSNFNPYYNNNVGNLYPNLQNFGGQVLFQSPEFTHILGGGDISSVARGVMQIASALMMNVPQNNMNNGLMPYNPRPHYPIMNQSCPPLSAPQFPSIRQNFSYNEPTHLNHHSFNLPRRNMSNMENLFDMPQQRNFGTPNHIRFSDDSNSPDVENNHNFTMDPSRSSHSEFDSSNHNVNHPTTNRHLSVGKSFRSNRGEHFRSLRGRFPLSHQNHRGRISRMNSRGGPSGHSRFIDPAYIKPDVIIPDEQNLSSQRDFVPFGSTSANENPVEIVSIDDDFVPSRGNFSRRLSRKERKRIRRMKAEEANKKRCPNPITDTVPEIVFIDSPTVSNTSIEEPTYVKQEIEPDIQVKTESINERNSVKQEEAHSTMESVKRESVNESKVKVENQAEMSVKSEEACGKTGGVTVKVEHGESGQNVRVEIKIESSSDTSSVVSLPLANLVKEEPSQVKEESVEVKTEGVNVDSVKTEDVLEHEIKEGSVDSSDRVPVMAADTVEVTVGESMDTSNNGAETTIQNESQCVSNQIDSTVGKSSEELNGNGNRPIVNCENSYSRTGQDSKDSSKEKASSWAEVKKQNLPLSTFQDANSQDDSESEDEEIRPLLRPKHCKTIGTVLSALQIFSPFTATPPEDVVRLKISFDLYLPTDFRKSHRGLPQYRIVVFSGSEALPTPAQLREVNHRFQDRVPVLTAVVTPGSVVLYTFSDIDLPQDTTSYKN